MPLLPGHDPRVRNRRDRVLLMASPSPDSAQPVDPRQTSTHRRIAPPASPTARGGSASGAATPISSRRTRDGSHQARHDNCPACLGQPVHLDPDSSSPKLLLAWCRHPAPPSGRADRPAGRPTSWPGVSSDRPQRVPPSRRRRLGARAARAHLAGRCAGPGGGGPVGVPRALVRARPPRRDGTLWVFAGGTRGLLPADSSHGAIQAWRR